MTLLWLLHGGDWEPFVMSIMGNKGKYMPIQESSYAYRIEGGYPVIGEITCSGAKNFAIKAMVAALLGDTATTLTNAPAIGDVDITADMLASIGVTVERVDQQQLMIDASTLSSSTVTLPHSGSNRAPILML